jgi:hypothetical protein
VFETVQMKISETLGWLYSWQAQREVYNVILDVMKECFKMCRPGVTLSQIHNHSVSSSSRFIFIEPVAVLSPQSI